MQAISDKHDRSFTFRLTSSLFFIFLAMALVTGCGGSDDDDDGPGIQTIVVETDDGAVACVDGSTMVACKGIPYALPPTGSRRFAPPEEISAVRTETLNATRFGNTCPQVASDFGDRSETEDCLFLNVFVPKDDTDPGPYPVMVWLHGGAFISGASGTESDNPYNPTKLVAQGVVVVTVNYRLGALGFLPHAALTAEEGESGNYGLMDQHMALEWIQDHIADFDGDPDNVTLFGESAGGHSVLDHLVAPSSFSPRYLFHKAIVQSGAYSPAEWDMQTQGYAYYGVPFATLAGCTSGDNAAVAACLRDLTVSEILTAQDQMEIWPSPVYAGPGAFLEQSIFNALSADEIPADVPVIIGCNKNEGQLFTVMDLAEGTYYATEAEYDAAVAATLLLTGLDADAIGDHYLLHYPDADAGRYRKAISEFRTDFMFVYNNKVAWDQMSNATDVYAYWFTDEEAPLLSDDMATAEQLLSIGATHSFEIQYVFGTLGARGATADQITLSDTMIGYWTNFAKNGVPDLDWDTYVIDDEVVLQLDDPTPVVTDAIETVDGFCQTHECDYWDGLLGS